MQNTIQDTTVYSKSAMLTMKDSAAASDDEKTSGITLMDAAKVARAFQWKNPKKTNCIEEDELSTTASSGNEGYGTTKQKKSSAGEAGKMDAWMMAPLWGLAAALLMACGYSLLACAAAAFAIMLVIQRKEVAAPSQKSAPWATGPRSGAAPVKKNLRPHAPNSGSKPRSFAPAAPQKMVILSPKSVSTAPAHFAAATQPPKLTSSPSPSPSPSAPPASTAELQKLLATPATPVVTAAMRQRGLTACQAQRNATNMRPTPASPLAPPAAAAPYTATTFRRELVNIMKELAQDRNAAVAVGKIRSQGVPQDRQSAEFADILTRAMEERNGPVRRTYVAFAAGLAAGGEGSAFNIDECVKGTGVFFAEVYEELCTEVPRLDKIVECELVPTLRNVLSPELIKAVLPAGM